MRGTLPEGVQQSHQQPVCAAVPSATRVCSSPISNQGVQQSLCQGVQQTHQQPARQKGREGIDTCAGFGGRRALVGVRGRALMRVRDLEGDEGVRARG